jgi:hypothetical protein
MCYLSQSSNLRHVFYNGWDPTTRAFIFPQSALVDAMSRAGYPCLVTLASGWCFPAYHCMVGQYWRCGIAIDYMPRIGAFTTTYPSSPIGDDIEFLWPHAAIGRDSTLHMVCLRQQGSPPEEYFLFCYAQGHPNWDEEGHGLGIVWDTVGATGEYACLDTVPGYSGLDVTCSPLNDRVVVSYLRADDPLLATDHNLWIRISEDGGHNWPDPVNVTTFAPEDTFRAYMDCSTIFDRSGDFHVAFVASRVLEFPNDDYVVWSRSFQLRSQQ